MTHMASGNAVKRWVCKLLMNDAAGAVHKEGVQLSAPMFS